jgi:hypothetical protein
VCVQHELVDVCMHAHRQHCLPGWLAHTNDAHSKRAWQTKGTDKFPERTVYILQKTLTLLNQSPSERWPTTHQFNGGEAGGDRTSASTHHAQAKHSGTCFLPSKPNLSLSLINPSKGEGSKYSAGVVFERERQARRGVDFASIATSSYCHGTILPSPPNERLA